MLALHSATCGCTGADIGSEITKSGDGPNFSGDIASRSESKGSQQCLPPPPIEKWPFQYISYSIDIDTPLPRERVQEHARAAFDEWEWATEGQRLFFEVEPDTQAHIRLSFVSGDHVEDCDCGFDSPTQTLAHSFVYNQSCLAGTTHFNSDLPWTTEGSAPRGTYDLRYALLHEIGHLIGLEHVDDKSHIMFTAYSDVPIWYLTEEEKADVLALLAD